MKCPTCGTENEATNRFCDQCGSRLEPSAAPTAAAATCPSCGATVLPGEAFCDECGASLSSVAPVSTAASYDAPTVYAPPKPSGAAPESAGASGSASTATSGQTCAACGHQNLPGDRFCDNCGAALAAPAAAGGPDDAELLRSLNEAPPAQNPPAEPSQPREAPAAEPPQREKIGAPDLPTAEQPILSAEAAYQSERKRLEDEIARQQQIIAQFEQMQATFGAATPAAVTQGLAEARDALARVQAEFDALQPPAPEIDPAEVARLNDEIARQQQIIAQFEQMQATFGAATPAAVTQGLAEARDAKARAEAELAALGAKSAPAAVPAGPPEAPPAAAQPVAQPPSAPPEPPSAQVPAAGPPSTAPVLEPVAQPPSAPAPVQPAPAGGPAPTGAPAPRLVIEDGGKELPLPTNKAEIIVGREDPISGIFPEIDLTPYGGESGGVSRQHARISRMDGQWTVTDLNSTNYTRVDGNKLDPSLPVPIKDGSRIQFGRVAVTFRE